MRSKAMAFTISPPVLRQMLPAGWAEQQDENGFLYYINHNTQASQWEHPGEAAGIKPSPTFMNLSL